MIFFHADQTELVRLHTLKKKKKSLPSENPNVPKLYFCAKLVRKQIVYQKTGEKKMVW